MHRFPDRRYFTQKSAETKFRAPELEKLYRLMLLLSELNRGELIEFLALRGGTTINLCYQDLPRLSIDIDLVSITNGSKENMLKNRETIRERISKIFEQAGYELDPHLKDYALDRYELKYRNAFDAADRLKVEVNYVSSRVPIYGMSRYRAKDLFGMSMEEIQTLSIVEVYGSKIEALVKRHTPRDLFDVYVLATHGGIDIAELRKCTIFSCCAEIPWDFRDLIKHNPADQITEREVNDELVPFLRTDRGFDVDHAKGIVRRFLDQLFTLDSDERDFLDRFFDEGKYIPNLLFPDKEHLQEHPGIKWRLEQLGRGVGTA